MRDSNISPKSDPLTPLCDEIYRRVMPRIMAALSETGRYASDGPLPPNTSRRVFNRKCRSGLPGAIKDPGGKSWSCPKAAWFDAGKPALVRVRTPANDDDAMADRFLAAAGLRATR